MPDSITFPVVPQNFADVSPKYHGSLCDEITKLGQFDILLAALMNFVTDGCNLSEGFQSMLCDNDCETTTTTTTVCLFGEATTTTTSTTTLCAPPEAPVLTLDLEEADNNQMSWADIPEAEQYKVYRSVDGGAYSLLANKAGFENDHTDNDCPTGHTYDYKITACDEACGCSEYSNIIETEV